jgi:hypothetical protein
MNRRQALQVILLAPAAKLDPQDNGTTMSGTAINVWRAYRLRMELADKQGDGITDLEVTYNGKSLKFSAKEIWEALKPEPSFLCSTQEPGTCTSGDIRFVNPYFGNGVHK